MSHTLASNLIIIAFTSVISRSSAMSRSLMWVSVLLNGASMMLLDETFQSISLSHVSSHCSVKQSLLKSDHMVLMLLFSLRLYRPYLLDRNSFLICSISWSLKNSTTWWFGLTWLIYTLHPWVCQHLLWCQPLVGIPLEQSSEQISALFRYVILHTELALHDQPVQIVHVVRFEWNGAIQHGIEHHAWWPQVSAESPVPFVT